MIDDRDDKSLRERYRREHAELVADIAERAKMIQRDETLACSTPRPVAAPVTKSFDYSTPRRSAAPVAGSTEGWQRYIARQLDQRERSMMKAVAAVVVEEERKREKLETEVAELRAEIAELRGAKQRLRAVPSDPGAAMIA